MGHLLRGKQAGLQNDFSAGVRSDLFVLDDLGRFGISSQVAQIAYDPVQSLVAVGTKDTRFGAGQIYVFGRDRISVTLRLPRKASVRFLNFCADRLLCLDDKNEFSIYSLETKKLLIAYSPPGIVNTFVSDPTLDYALFGLRNGEILTYDLDRENIAPFRLPNFWAQQYPRSRGVPILSLEFHPRDIGTLLIGYLEGAVVYSFKQNKPLKFFQYTVPRGAPGGDSDPASFSNVRTPRLTQATWHPTGTFILTCHEDSSLVIWDPKEGRVIIARTLTESFVDQPGARRTNDGQSGSFSPKTSISRVVWCANRDPDDTAILVAGGITADSPAKNLTLLEFGRTPVYATSSWTALAQHFEKPKKERLLPTPPKVEVVNFCLIPRSTPWFAGAHDPIALIALLSSGEIITLSFPSGFPISPTNKLPVSMTFVHPFVQCVSQNSVDRTRWLGMTETRSSGPDILRGGAEGPRPLKRFEDRNIIITAHADGTIRLWDAGHGDELENVRLLQADLARAAGDVQNLAVTALSLSGASGELAAGLESGEVVIFRWSQNNNSGMESTSDSPNTPRALTKITERRDPSLTEGLHPFTLLSQGDGPVTALRVSDVGFIAAGFRGGSVAIIDMRGPAIIYNANISEFKQRDKGRSMRRPSVQARSKQECASIMEFSVLTLEGEQYSSILLHVGTDQGRVATFKILPGQGGRYTAEYAGSTALENKVLRIHPINASTGHPAYATPGAVSGLREGRKSDGALLAVTMTEARIFKPATAKGAHKSWDNMFCDSAQVTRCHDHGSALVCLFGDGTARSYTLPGLKEISSVRVDQILDVKRFPEAAINASGDIIGWTGPSELALLNVWGTGEGSANITDKLFNPEATIPPRPTISNLQWVSGTQYMTPSDLDIIIGGPGRPPSKRMLAQAQADEQAQRAGARAGPSKPGEEEGYWAYMQRQLNERTERLGMMGDSVDRLEENSSGWAEDVNSFISKQKRNMVTGVIKSKFGF